ncbi:iron-sulfur cluster assembly scaffold protein [Parahaliea sp. F7430]|uniref:Iron-sulfur cluster assembly scaffold protein n=1 Tax=Sediminihaliea albiluteola TaxID=2758564 RepID=A0A7W2TTM1_9GAMM|nr:iron-sulfur cluster assembly scaffold protein [Sediminihaliea albiluteola]MBA6411777.1 iron-sulfur cluster assembly scaffold protein [Sediminihaliea albiluteola]
MSKTITKDGAEKLNPIEFTAALKEYRAYVRRQKRLSGEHVRTTTVHSRQLCGSQLTLDAHIEHGTVKALGFSIQACSLGQASTAMVLQRAEGLTKNELQRAAEQLEVLLVGQWPAEALIWPELAIFIHADSMPARHDSARLVFRALLQLFEEEENSV